MAEGAPDKKEVEEKEKRLRENIAKHSSHIKNVELQLQQLQLQLNLTSGPKKSALEMLRKKIEAKNEEVVLARNKFLSAQKAAEQAQDVLQGHERSKEQLCQELHLLVHQSATAELNKLEQLTKQLDQLNRGGAASQSAADAAALEQAKQAAATWRAPSAQDAAAATTEQQTLAAAETASPQQPGNAGDGPAPPVGTEQHNKPGPARPSLEHTDATRGEADHTGQPHGPVPAQQSARKKGNQHRRQILRGAQESSVAQAANDSAGRFAGFQS